MITEELASIYNHYMVWAALWYVTHVFGMRNLFAKAHKNKAIAYIPLYREVVLFETVWAKKNIGWIWLALFVLGHGMYFYGASANVQVVAWLGFVGILAAFYLWLRKCYKESRAYNCSNGTCVGLILLNMIFTIWLGSHKEAEYKGARD